MGSFESFRWNEGKGHFFSHLFLIASPLPILWALLTVSARLTLPIARRFILEGLGNLVIQSGTVEPDCKMTLATLERELAWIIALEEIHLHFEEGAIFIGEECCCFSFATHTSSPSCNRLDITKYTIRYVILTNSMDIALNTLREIIVDNLTDALEIHSSRHDLRGNHHPTLALSHTTDCIFSFFLGHPSVQVIDIRSTTENKLFGE